MFQEFDPGDGFAWRRASSSLDVDEDTLEGHRESITSGARALREDAFVKVSTSLFFIVGVPQLGVRV